MGAVHKETPGQNIGYHEFESVTLSDNRCVAYLIRWRNRIYPADKAMDHFSDIMVCIYIDLYRLIEDAPLTNAQRMTVEKLLDGYTIEDLSEIWNIDRRQVDGFFRRACITMAEYNAAKSNEFLLNKIKKPRK